MTGFFCKTLLLGTLVVLALSKYSTATSTLEDKVQELNDKYFYIEEVLKGRVQRLEAKVDQLESKVQEQESLLISLRQKNGESAASANLLIAERNFETYRTCSEALAFNPSLTSGMYLIDPDIQGIGDGPINVYCDMVKGSTFIFHDTESPTEVRHCAEPGCYSRAINYHATMRQMIALAELSSECRQSIKYDCISAPLEVSGVAYSWWNDRNGKEQYFWAGSNSSVHICQCGIDRQCVEVSAKCNCDSSLPVLYIDDGFITDKKSLPITRLNYGRTIFNGSLGIHTLGRLECTGKAIVNGKMPSSCADLWVSGHTLSGLHSIMGTDMVEMVYCDFTKLPSEQNFQMWIGFADVKSSSVYFYVQKNTIFNSTNSPIPFEIEKLNMGGAINLASGIFTAPKTGTYFFSFSGVAHISASESRLWLFLNLYHNGVVIGSGEADESSLLIDANETISIQSTLNLKAGDRVWVQITEISPGVYLEDTINQLTHFTGWLIQEKVF